MSYALPSMTRVPPRRRASRSRTSSSRCASASATSPRLRNVVLVVAGAVLIYLTAKVSFPIPGNPVPYTLQNFGVLVVGGGARPAARRLGRAPVRGARRRRRCRSSRSARAGSRSSSARPAATSSGSCSPAPLVGRLAELGWDRRIGGAIGATALGTLVIYAVGVPWLAVDDRACPCGEAIEVGMLPFIVVDIVKLLAAAAVFPAAWWVVGRRPSDR